MTGNVQAIGFLLTWVLGWGIGGSLIDAGLIQSGVYSLEGGQLGTLITFLVWTGAWGGAGGVGCMECPLFETGPGAMAPHPFGTTL